MTALLVVDADGLIKLAKAGLIESLVGHANVVVGRQVWREAVEEGMARGHEDAAVLAGLAGQMTVAGIDAAAWPDMPEAALRLGAGERETWAIWATRSADAVVSDDRAFLGLLTQAGVPYLTPAAVAALLLEAGVVSLADGRDALERLRPFIRQEQYQLVMAWLTERGGSST